MNQKGGTSQTNGMGVVVDRALTFESHREFLYRSPRPSKRFAFLWDVPPIYLWFWLRQIKLPAKKHLCFQ